MPYLAAAFLILLLLVPAPAPAQAQSPAEVFMSGMRNPYRWSFDRETGDVYVGDVGGINEEVTFVPWEQARGANLGWNCFSGTAVQSGCSPSNYFPPQHEYPSGPDVVIGGYVVHDSNLPSFAGQYLFGRHSSGDVISLGPAAAEPPADTDLDVPSVSGFGEDGEGHLYAASLEGPVYRLGESSGTLTKTSIGSFDQPLSVAAAPGRADELFIAEKPGRVQRWTPAGTNEVIDMTEVVGDTGFEEGLLSVAVSPDYATTGRLFVFYTDNAGNLQVDELRNGVRSPVLTVPHGQARNHNGGQLLFGPDGALYLSTGDGGPQGDPEGDAQNPGSQLGKILRIDLSRTPGGPVLPVTPPDTSAPGVTARAPRRQRVARNRGAIVYLRCTENCTLAVGGTLRFAGRRLLFRRASVAALANDRIRLRLRLRPRVVRRLRRALQAGRRPKVTLRIRARDSVGNAAPLVVRAVRVRG